MEYEASQRGKREKRITGKRAGHEIHLEIEDVLDKIKMIIVGNNMCCCKFNAKNMTH